MRILFVTQFFYPENFRINDLARYLAAAGHEVTVLTGLPNYPGGSFFDGYTRKGPYKEKMDGVNIRRVFVIPRKKGGLWLSLNYLSFVLFGCLETAAMEPSDYDVIYAFGTSPITQALPALVLKKMGGVPVILNVQDLWPDNVEAITGVKNPVTTGLLDMLVDFIYNRCDLVLGTSRSFVKAIKSRRGLKEKRKVVFWPQYATVERSSEERRDILPEGYFHIVFTGNVGQGQGLDTLIRAAALLKEEYEGRLVFDIVGDGRARADLMSETKKAGLEDMIRFHGSFPEKEIPGILNTADAALLILKDDEIFKRTIPAKLQTYLKCGAPVVGCVCGESRQLIEKYGVGVCAKGMGAKQLAAAVREVMSLERPQLEEMGERGARLSDEMFDRDTLIERLLRYMEILAG